MSTVPHWVWALRRRLDADRSARLLPILAWVARQCHHADDDPCFCPAREHALAARQLLLEIGPDRPARPVAVETGTQRPT